ncbi:MAG: response regulator transcription factor [Polyangiaceae bacterium]
MTKNDAEGKPKQRVLVVEDDANIALGLRINLEAEGYDVVCADDGEVALREFHRTNPDLILLDVMLPRLNGFEVLQELRRGGHATPIIVLSARTGEIDKVTGLELGAEDYVEKPFSLAELLARVRGALRRGRRHVPSAHEVVVFGAFRIDLDARTVHRADAAIEITATEFDVLQCLVRARGKALSREDIWREVWGPSHHGTPRTIDNFIQQLRAKFEEDREAPKHFITVRGVGYRFEA